jgi:TolB-like protein
MSESTPRAVFLSYAREDTDAARRIADALRGFGVEVWFDQNELRGGDQWDARIRGQIKTCALFIPVISATTLTREEAYFRLEWKLADDRSHLMAPGKPFIVPVVIDETPETGAAVPDSFARSQWTRLSGGEPSTAFIEQVKSLLGAGRRRPSLAPMETVRSTAPMRTRPPMTPLPPIAPKPAAPVAEAPPLRQKSRRRLWFWVVLVAVLVAAGTGAFLYLRGTGPAASPPVIARNPAAVTPAVPAAVVPAAPAAPASGDKSIAVLPFVNMSEDKDNNAFFADGIHEDLLTNLALIPELKVISRTSVMQYRGTTKTTRQIGGELGVAYVLEGSVRRAGNKVRVTGQLINTHTDEHVWAKSYDRDLTDIFAIQTALSQEIASALSAAISPETQKFIARRPTDNPAAYDLYLKARDTYNRSPISSTPALREQEALFKQAVQLDPNFAAAWGELARVHALFAFWGIDGSPARLVEADAAIAQAVRIAPDAPEVIGALGTYAYYAYRDYSRATAQYEKLAKLQPNNPTVYSSLGLIQRRQGRWAESLVSFRHAAELDPGNINTQRNVRQITELGRHWDEARAAHQRLITLLPDQLREQLDLADGEFAATGSWQVVDALLARLTPAQRDSPIGLYYRKQWAMFRGDYAEFKRIDRLQPALESEGPSVYAAVLAGLVYFAAGDKAAVRTRLAAPLAEWRARMEHEPGNPIALATVGQMEALVSHPKEAVRLVRKAMELVPESRDAVDGPSYGYYLAQVYAVIGEKDQALAELSHLLHVPLFYSVAQIRGDPAFAKLRGDPRFETLLADPKNNDPLF